jgi:hypothetical protein
MWDVGGTRSTAELIGDIQAGSAWILFHSHPTSARQTLHPGSKRSLAKKAIRASGCFLLREQ